jgi:predicted permease
MVIGEVIQSILPIILMIALGYVLHEKHWIDDGLLFVIVIPILMSIIG